MADSPPLTFSVLAAGMLNRWKAGAIVIAGTLIVAAGLMVILPPVYEARASFIVGSAAPARIASAFSGGALSSTGLSSSVGSSEGIAVRGLSFPDDRSGSPQFNLHLIESVELRRRLLHSRFRDPRGTSAADSATLIQILKPRSDDPQRRFELALRRIDRATTATLDKKSNLVKMSVRLAWPELAAAVANRTMALVVALNNEQRLSRASEAREFLESRVRNAETNVRDVEDRQRRFYEQNRQWKASPYLVSVEARLRREASLSRIQLVTLRREFDAAPLANFTDPALLTIVDRAIPPRRAFFPRYGFLFANALTVGFILGLLATSVATIVSHRGQGQRSRLTDHQQDLLAEAEGSASRRPPPGRGSFLSSAVFPLFAWGLVLHSLVMAALFGWFGLSEQTVRIIAAWKEAALALLCIVVVVRAVAGIGPRVELAWPDLLVAGLMSLAVLFLLIETVWLRYDLPPAAGPLGLRDAVYFMLAYFIGRATPELASDESAMRRVFLLILITSAIGVVERFIVSPEMLVGLGVASYFQDFLGVSAFTVGNDYGLPLNYWTTIGGHLFRRAGSVYLSGQGFAVPFLLFFPFAIAWTFLRPTRSRVAVIAFLIISAGLALTLTRMTILVALIQLILFASLRRRPHWAVVATTVAASGFAIAFVAIPGFPTFVWETLSWQEGSSVSHVSDWASGLAALAQSPWGSGLGTTDQTAVRAGLEPLTGDNLFLKYGVELGVAGLVLLVFILAAFGNYGRSLFMRGLTLNQQRLGMTLLLASIGIAFNGATASVFNSIALGWLFFWIAGSVVTAAARLPDVVSKPA